MPGLESGWHCSRVVRALITGSEGPGPGSKHSLRPGFFHNSLFTLQSWVKVKGVEEEVLHLGYTNAKYKMTLKQPLPRRPSGL